MEKPSIVYDMIAGCYLVIEKNWLGRRYGTLPAMLALWEAEAVEY